MKQTDVNSTMRSKIRRFFDEFHQDSLIERQRKYVFVYAIIGTIIVVMSIGHQALLSHDIFAVVRSIILASIALIFCLLYVFRVLTIDKVIFILIAIIQTAICARIIAVVSTGGIEARPIILINSTFLGLFLMLSIMAYIRYLPYIQSIISILTLSFCWYVTDDFYLWSLTIMFIPASLALSFMGNHLLSGIESLENNKEDLLKEQERIFRFFNMSKEELLQLIRLSQRKSLSDKQKERLIELLDEQTRTSVIEIATDVIAKKKQNIMLLDAREFNLTSYEKQICMLVLQEKSVSQIAAKLKKSPSAITSTRAVIRGKLGLARQDNLRDALLDIVEAE